MSWLDRIKRAFLTFKRMALPLYAWYIILTISGAVLIILSLVPMIVALAHAGMLNSELSGFPRLPGIPFSNTPIPPLSGPYPNPNPPAPPGNNFSPAPQSLIDGVTPFLSFVPAILLTFIVLIVVGWLLSSAFMTGMFHLTKKAYTGQVKFKDFRFKGCSRVLGWYGFLTLLGLFLVGFGVFVAAAVLPQINYAIPVFAGIYTLLLCSVAIYLAPWLSTSAFYMLNHRELSFGESFRKSWRFYRRHQGSFWGYFVTVIGLQIVISIINRNSPDIGLIIALLVNPFVMILPIVWVLTHEEEENPLPSVTPAERPSPELTLDHPVEVFVQELPSPNPVQYSPQPFSQELPQVHQESSDQQYPLSKPNPSQVSSSQYSPQITPEEASQINFCPTCGKNVRPGASYCSQCGTKL